MSEEMGAWKEVSAADPKDLALTAMLEMEAELYCARGAVMAVRAKRTGFGGKHIGKF